MNYLTIVRKAPESASLNGPGCLTLTGAMAFFGSLGEAGGGWGVGLLLLAGGGWWTWSRMKDRRVAADAFAQYVQRVNMEVAQLNASPPLAEPAGVNLLPGEACYWSGSATWHELRKVTKRVNYSGASLSIPIAGGLRYRVGTIAGSPQREEELVEIDSGTLYVTSTRLFFDGHAKNVTLRYRDVSGIQSFMGGIQIERQSGRSPILTVPVDAERGAATAAWALAAANA